MKSNNFNDELLKEEERQWNENVQAGALADRYGIYVEQMKSLNENYKTFDEWLNN